MPPRLGAGKDSREIMSDMDRRQFDELKSKRDGYIDAQQAFEQAKLNLKFAGNKLDRAIEEDPTGASELKLVKVGKEPKKTA